jgi:hypothetical protein
MSVYKLTCSNGFFYIGSTIQPLENRLWGHHAKAKLCPERKLYAHLDENATIELIEEADPNVLRECEDKHIRAVLEDPLCLNSRVAVLTDEEKKAYQLEQQRKHCKKYNDKRKEYKSNWFQNISEEQKQHRREYAKNYYANLTEEQKQARVERNKLRRKT